MAKATAFCTCEICGNEFQKTKQLASKQIDSWVDWVKENITICPECELEQVLTDIANDKELPQLKGTPKQIKWAFSIRKTALTHIENDRKVLHEVFNTTDFDKEKRDQIFEYYEQTINEIKQNCNADFWIEEIESGRGLLDFIEGGVIPLALAMGI